jgi:hypothetical protein
MRVGVLADTHLHDREARLLAPLLRQVWGSIELVLHAGDVVSPLVIDVLNEIAPTLVVAGNMDGRESAPDAVTRQHWPRSLVVPIGAYQIGLIHGDFMRSVPAALPPLWRRSARFDAHALHAYLRAQFDQVQAIVFGHTHRPHREYENGVLFFNPGAFRGEADNLGTVGTLNIDELGIKAEIISLADLRLG